MKRKIRLGIFSIALGLLATGCGPWVNADPDAMVGGGIYPPPVYYPPLVRPNTFRPGGPYGPGFFHPGLIGGQIRPSRPGSVGRPTIGNSGGGNQRVPGTGVGAGNQPAPPAANPGGTPGGLPPR